MIVQRAVSVLVAAYRKWMHSSLPARPAFALTPATFGRFAFVNRQPSMAAMRLSLRAALLAILSSQHAGIYLRRWN
jgi:hypothetical protein